MATKLNRPGSPGKLRLHADSLPVVEPKTTLRAALTQLQRTKDKALIVRTGDEFLLHTMEELNRACTTNAKRRLRDLTGYQIHVGDLTGIAESTPDPFLSSDALLTNLEASGKRFALLSAPTDKASHAIVFFAGSNDLQFVEPGPKDRCPICRHSPCDC
jgi:hypothetical protein